MDFQNSKDHLQEAIIADTSSKEIFSVIFLVLMLSSWLEMNTMFFSTSFQPYFLIHALNVLSEKVDQILFLSVSIECIIV